jgi:glutaredoxin
MHLILYSKPGCHLCAGLQEKLEQIQNLSIDLEVRDITSRDDWFQAYQYEVPVLFWQRHVAENEGQAEIISISRPSPRASVQQLARQLAQLCQQYSEQPPM